MDKPKYEIGDRDRSDLTEILNNFWQEICNRWRDDEEILEHLRRQLEDMESAVNNQLARIRMSKIEE